MDIILASTSPYRAELLKRAGIPFRAHRPLIDEESLKTPSLTARELCRHLARAKAESLSEAFPSSIIVGCDQLVHFNGAVLGKPGSRERAIDQLLALQGKQHELLTALCVLGVRSSPIEHLDITRIQLRKLDRESITNYVDFDQPFVCAGSYKIESGGIRLIENLDCADFTAIVGLPIIALVSALRQLGIKV